jgi:hypothetical protein
MFFAGFEGRTSIRVFFNEWFIFEQSPKGQKLIGTVNTHQYSNDVLTLRGLRLITCTATGKNEKVSEHFKITNVSKVEITFKQNRSGARVIKKLIQGHMSVNNSSKL